MLVVVLEVQVFGGDIVGVVLVRNTIIIKLHESIILNLLLLLGVDSAIPLILELVFLELSDLISIMLVLNILLLLEKLVHSLEWLTAVVDLVINLTELIRIIRFWDIIEIIFVIELELNQLWIIGDQIMLRKHVELLLVGKVVDSLNGGASSGLSQPTHIREFLNNIIGIILMLVIALNVLSIRELLNDIVAIVIVIAGLDPLFIFNDVLSVFSVVIQLNESCLIIANFWVTVMLLMMLVLHLCVFTFEVLVEIAGVVSVWRKLSIVKLLVVIIDSLDVLWGISDIWVVGRVVVRWGHVSMKLIVFRVFLVRFMMLSVMVALNLNEGIRSWNTHGGDFGS